MQKVLYPSQEPNGGVESHDFILFYCVTVVVAITNVKVLYAHSRMFSGWREEMKKRWSKYCDFNALFDENWITVRLSDGSLCLRRCILASVFNDTYVTWEWIRCVLLCEPATSILIVWMYVCHFVNAPKTRMRKYFLLDSELAGGRVFELRMQDVDIWIFCRN